MGVPEGKIREKTKELFEIIMMENPCPFPLVQLMSENKKQIQEARSSKQQDKYPHPRKKTKAPRAYYF